VIRIGLIGDRDDSVVAHRAIPLALERASASTGVAIELDWIHTTALAADPARAAACDGIWCIPASPYASGVAALGAIRAAREDGTPFLGTCGGYQYALVEFARDVLGLEEAALAEEDPDAALLLIGRLSCDLVEVTGRIRAIPGSRFAAICGGDWREEGYHCRFGLDRAHAARFGTSALRIVAEDEAGDPRAFELEGHPFFFGTAFQPERSALDGRDHPLIAAFVRAVAEAKGAGTLRAAQASLPTPPLSRG
jgi:CTP synthase (UTP-ammonia lyase)